MGRAPRFPRRPMFSQRFALDTQGFEALKNQSRAGNNHRTPSQAAAKQFEAVFTQMVLKEYARRHAVGRHVRQRADQARLCR